MGQQRAVPEWLPNDGLLWPIITQIKAFIREVFPVIRETLKAGIKNIYIATSIGDDTRLESMRKRDVAQMATDECRERNS